MNSTHKVEVAPVKLEPHPNADSLSVVRVYGYTVCVRTADWRDGMLGAYIPPDSIVDTTRPEFAFLANGKPTHRVKAKKLRGVVSFGLLIPAPEGAKDGDDVAKRLGVTHYEPPITNAKTGGEAESPPRPLACLSKYDIDSLRRYGDLFKPGEYVYVTEKIHGANARYAWVDGRMWCGSRTEWKREDKDILWWRALTPEMEEFCKAYENCVLYGEVYGNVQHLKYGCKNEVKFAAFDILGVNGTFVEVADMRPLLEHFLIPAVPLLYEGPYDFEKMCELAEGQSTMHGADHVREGCVVRPRIERWHQAIGRVCLKVVGAGYLERS